MRDSKPILLVEDDRVDTMMVERAFKDIKIANPLVRTTTGEQALEYLRNESNKKPCVILLDLNMPRMNGMEFLEVIKADETLKKIPVAALTTSREEHDIADCFKLGVAGYIVKPVDYKKFVEAIKIIEVYWTLSRLPSGG